MKKNVRVRLIEERKYRRWSQQEVADLIGTTQRNVSRWESGLTTPGPYFRTRLCELFGKSVEELGLIESNLLSPVATRKETAEAVPVSSSSSATEMEAVGTVQASASTPEGPMLWTIPYPRNPHFTGRDDLLDQLDRSLSFEERHDSTTILRAALVQPQAIKGLGGIGKTQIAIEYAYRTRERGRYYHILWVNAASEETIIASLQGFAEQLPSFPAKEEKDRQRFVAAVKSWLEQCSQLWLLIFDNADDISFIQEYIPRKGNGSMLLTTRANAVGAFATSINVENMGLAEGTMFLLHRAQRQHVCDEERDVATNVVIALDGFPLALDQAGAYIEETGCSFGEYLQLYQSHRKVLLARRGIQTTSYPDSVATTWSLSLHKVEQVNPAAVELLRLCAFLAPDQIPEELLTEHHTHWPPLLQQATADLLSFNQMIEVLLAFSLVKRLAEDHLLSIHRLVQAVIMDAMEMEQRQIWARRMVEAVNESFPQLVTATTWSHCRRYLPHAQQSTLWIQEYGFAFEAAASLLFRTASYLYDHALYAQAEQLLKQAQQIWEQVLGPNHLDVAACLYRLAIIYSQQAKYEQARLYHERALHIREQVLGADHPDVAASLYRLAIIYALRGQDERAEPLFQQALCIWEQKLGSDHLGMAGALDGLAIIYAQQGKNIQAEPLFQRALRIREQVLGADHPDIAASLSNLANFFLAQEQYEQAESLAWRAVRIWEQVLEPNHPYVAYPLEVLAEVYAKQEKYGQSEALYKQVLHIREQAFEPFHPVTAATLHDFASLYVAQGKLQEAVSLYQRALLIREQVLGMQHIETAETRKCLHTLLEATGKAEEAVEFQVTQSHQEK